MGCASSKQTQTQTRCQHCQNPCSPLPRSYSVPVHHRAARKGDSYHVVALTSSTLGSLPADSIERFHLNANFNEDKQISLAPITTNTNYRHVNDSQSKEFLTEVLQAKNWSDMIEQKIPKVIPRTPTRTPPGEPETINAWELMEGLDDCSPFRLPNHHNRSFSFHVVSNTSPIDQSRLSESSIDSPTIGHSKANLQDNGIESPKLQETGAESPKQQEEGTESPEAQPKLQEGGAESPKQQQNVPESLKPQWLDMAEDDLNSNLSPIISDFDPEIVSQFRKALEAISPVAAVHLKSPERENTPFSRENHFLSKDFIDTKKADDIFAPTQCPPHGEDKVVIYFTSLRGVRKTYEDCCHVRVIFKGFGVRIDERDVSMHYGFREELKELSGEIGCGGGLPKVFVKGRYIGGAEEVRQLNEDGKLEKMVESCAKVEEGNCFGACELCGDVRFVPCESCSGSCKIYCEDDEWEGEESVGEFQRCPDCNENGIVRCPVCCY